MNKYLISFIYFALYVFSFNLFAQNADKAKRVLGRVAAECLSTEETYKDGLIQFLLNLTRHQAVFQKALSALEGDVVKKLFSKTKIEELKSFDAEMVKMIAQLKTILRGSVELKKHLNDLNDVANAANNDINSNAMIRVLNAIKKFFLDDKAFIEPYKAYVDNYQEFQTRYSNLFKQHIKNESFLDQVGSNLILPVQRLPRYKMLFEQINNQIDAWSAVDTTNYVLKTLKSLSEKLLGTIVEKTRF